jgi:hypothetical protein
VTAGIEVDAGLTLQVGRLASALEAQHRDYQEQLNQAVRFIKATASQQTVSAAGVANFGFRGPPTGYMWTVRRIAVSDSAAVTNTLAGTAYVYAGAITGSAYLEPENLEWIISPLPNVADFSSDQLVLQYGEHLYVQLTGGTSGQVVKANVAYQLYRPGARGGSVQV